MNKRAVVRVSLTAVLVSLLILAFSAPFVEASGDPTISGTVRDKEANPIPNVLIVAQDASTGVEVAQATSDASGAYFMPVPSGTYDLVVTPPWESGFAGTTISSVQTTPISS